MTASRSATAPSGGSNSTPSRNSRIINASPEKRFFIEMLVRDIELVPAIIDLVDNSVDSANALLSASSKKKLTRRIEIVADSKHFEISDNCAGIDAKIAREYAFRFGRPAGKEGSEETIGQFGIGMKRSLFKLGEHFIVESSTHSSSFTLDVDVQAWEKDTSTNWTFKFGKVSFSKNATNRPHGTRVFVDNLHESVASDLGTTKTINRLRAEISERHEAALANGIQISVNGKDLTKQEPVLLSSAEIQPIRKEMRLDFEEGTVDVSIYAGIAPPKARDSERDDGDAEEFTETSEAGWYIYCNDRLVVAAERSELTGWSRPVAAAYHPQYRDFRGYVYMRSSEPSLLPWDTTKTSLDSDSKVFRAIQGEMYTPLQQVQTVLNQLKKERTGGSKAGKLAVAMVAAKPVEIRRLLPSAIFIAPGPTKSSDSKTTNISFKLQKSEVAQLEEYFGIKSGRQAALMAVKQFIATEIES
jgi:hypothetical protein